MMDLTPILEAVIILVIAMFSCFAIPWIKKNKLEGWVQIFVLAAEQLFDKAEGEAKLNYVFEQLKSKGYNVDITAIRALIESEVYKLHNEFNKNN